MKTISENLASAMTKTSLEDKLGVIVRISGEIPKEFSLKTFEGLDGHGLKQPSRNTSFVDLIFREGCNNT